jgi:PKHD-type hydroxylase
MVEIRGPYSTHELHPEVFDRAECDRIIELGRSLPVDVGGIEGDDGMLEDHSLRAAEIAWVAEGPDTRWIHERLRQVCDDANQRYGFALSGFDEELQFTTYGRPGAFYTWHQDGLDGPVARRKLSLVVQLSDPGEYEGADLELFQVGEDYDAGELAEFRASARARGTVVVFPAFEYHRVTPLVSGVRHSLVSWVSGPPFR